LAILSAGLTAEKLNHKLSYFKLPISFFDLLPWFLIPGLIGARLFHVIDYFDYYRQNIIQVFYLWQGGLGIFGAMAGGIFGLWLFVKVKKINKRSLLKLLDLATLVLPLGQAIGRWANYFNQELYGLPTSLPWGIAIKPESRPINYQNFTKFHPLFFYESFGCLMIFIFFYCLLKTNKIKKPGTFFWLYLLFYGILRFGLEFLRINSWTINNFRVNQLICLGLIITSTYLLIKNNN